ncbi:MAG TPA: hypothetical protein PK771_05425, partial [Spirochaetota bacterium]|nr:hypothetical protein [Spirochaetota bacterium]
CITEHNILWQEREQDEIVNKFKSKIKIFFGIEVDTEIGHILLFGSDLKKIDSVIHLKDLLKKIERKRCALIWAHPFRWESSYPTKHLLNEKFLSNFDAIELYNGNLSNDVIETSKQKLNKFSLKLTGASDTHSRKMSCKYATKFDDDINNLEELVLALKYKEYKPITL